MWNLEGFGLNETKEGTSNAEREYGLGQREVKNSQTKRFRVYDV